MNEKVKELNFETDWAFSEKSNKEIHISQAESGLRGYRCLGCHGPMIANIQRKNPSRRSFFRHHATNIERDERQCVRANKEYREKIARNIINRLKYVNAPAIYKYPDEKDDSLAPMLIENRKIIKAYQTKSELTFYEDSLGKIKWVSNPDVKEKDLLIRPDVTFFNEKGKPILLIEFVITHKISIEKYVKIARLGIDTLGINIPKKSEAEIEKALQSTRKYKWIYNGKESETTYIPVSRRNKESLSQVDEDERIIFEETFKCRDHEIRECIRSIRKCLQSKQYRDIEQKLNVQLQKVERNTEREKQELERLEKSARKEALSRNRRQEEEIESRRSELEKRYYSKRDSLEQSTKKHYNNSSRGTEIIFNQAKEEKEIREIEQRIIREQNQSRFDKESIERELWEDYREEIERLNESIDKIKREQERIESRRENLEREIKSEIDEEEREVEQLIRRHTKRREGIEEEMAGYYRTTIDSNISEIGKLNFEEEKIDESTRAEFHRSIQDSSSELPKEIRNILQAKSMGRDFSIFDSKEKRYRSAREIFRKGTWKTW
jgi:hypothetical protein